MDVKTDKMPNLLLTYMKLEPATLLKVIPLHGWFLCLLNCVFMLPNCAKHHRMFLQLSMMTTNFFLWNQWYIIYCIAYVNIYHMLTHLFPMHLFSMPWKHDVFRGWRESGLGTNGLISMMSLFQADWASCFLSRST